MKLKNLLDVLTEGRVLPEGTDRWAIKATHPDLRTREGYRWPYPGTWAEAPGPIIAENNTPRPYRVGDGICLAYTWWGLASGRIPASTLLLCAVNAGDILGQDELKARVQRAFVVDLVDGARLIRDHGANTDLSSAKLLRMELRAANLEGSALSFADLRHANLEGSALSFADLRHADLGKANLAGADLGKANLFSTYLGDAYLAGANLAGADLRAANLSGADLWNANLQDVDLRAADLQDVDLRAADLRNANLWHVNLDGANLRAANLSGADMTPEQRDYAKKQGATL